jgi:hypothetical protein
MDRQAFAFFPTLHRGDVALQVSGNFLPGLDPVVAWDNRRGTIRAIENVAHGCGTF